MQHEIIQAGPLLLPDGHLAQVGWSRPPLLDCNLENAYFYALRFLQLIGCVADASYLCFYPLPVQFSYPFDYFNLETNELHEEGLVVPFGEGVELPRNNEVHQMFGHYNGTAASDEGEIIRIENLVGFGEEHQASL